MNKKQFLQSLNDVYCRLASTRHGVGVVALRTIPKGIDPFKRCDPHGDVLKIPQKEFEGAKAHPAVKLLVQDFCVLQDGYYHVPDYGIDAIDKSYFLNHSKNPNMVTHDQGETFVTKRVIQKGEELTSDYDTYQEYKKPFRLSKHKKT